MGSNNDYREERFDSYLNKIIIFSSKGYFKKQMNIFDKERTIVDKEDSCAPLKCVTIPFTIDNIENTLELNSALNSLSAIEQSVLFLLFKEDLSQDDAAKILEICSKSVSRIKLRAIDKLKKYLKEDLEDEK